MLNPIHLRTLLEVVRLGSFASAANRLGYTASAVSQQMAALENDAGIRLFERTARSIRPTEAAVVMAEGATTVLADIDRLLEAAGSAAERPQAELRVSVYPSLARMFLPRLLRSPQWLAVDAALRLSIRDPSPAIQALRRGEETDVTLVYWVGDAALTWPRSVTPVRLGADPMRVVVPTSWRLHGLGAVAADELVGRPWILHHPGSSDAAVIDAVLDEHGLRPRVVARSDDFAVTLDIVAAGYAATVMPEVALGEVPAGVEVLEVPEVQLSREVYALVSPTAPARPTDLFLRILRDISDDLGYGAGAGINRG
ncbi:LysR family transcriptional regulator [Microbacterium sp. ASV49]|uniref:LysR family transcriptional regulator n=1 Tax=Microbacterium candidum TaxID=3041922 RepID=A0ABT7MV58_9MICO|nr:LysR family transcriptional regulator [Microbacterium sp. ASV49]MDL9978342.1 LysR family transcriptional regulator [Microbacterium sp. ASV49]